jgi:hypothetical protein
MRNYCRSYFFKLKTEWRDKLKNVVEFGKKRARLEEDSMEVEDGIEDENGIEDDANDYACDWAGDGDDDDCDGDGDITFENNNNIISD